MKFVKKNGETSNILRFWIMDVATGDPVTGLTSGTTNLEINTIADVEASPTSYNGSNIESITTLGTFAAPTGGKVRFKEVSSGDLPGLYEIQVADGRFAVSGAKALIIMIMVDGLNHVPLEVQLDAGDVIADQLLARNVSGGSSAGRTVKQALHFIRNKWAVVAGTLTVYDTDDSTSSWTATVSQDAAANPIIGNDPS